MNPFLFFEKIYCINLEERLDRWEKCLEIFKQYEIKNFERVNGIKIPEDCFSYIDEKSKSQLGCALSFYTIIKNAYNNQFSNILIFEDDFYFIHSKEKTEEVLSNSIENLPEEWDVFYLGANIMYDYCANPVSLFSKYLFKINSAYCLHSIAFSRKGISAFIKKFPDEFIFVSSILDFYKAIDVFMAKEFCMDNLCFICDEMLCSQIPGFSSIENCMTDYSDLIVRHEKTTNSIK